nr:Protein of uncharacterised function (DUF2517) [Raoultella sp. NCTC 9187]
MLFWKDRARYYSWLHRVWAKTSEQPVWMAQAEKAAVILLIASLSTDKATAGKPAVFFRP